MQGQIKLALVSISVEIYPATESVRRSVSARFMSQQASPSTRQVVTGVDPVENPHGFEMFQGNYILL